MSEGNGFVTREQLLARAKRRYHEFQTPVGKVRIRNLTERERSRFESEILSSKGGVVKAKLEAARRRLIVLTVVDGNGDLLLQDADVVALEEQDSATTNLIYSQAREHCGFDEADVESLVGNSEKTTVVDSPSV